MMRRLPHDMRGFTLVEVLLSVAIISILAGLSLPLYQSFQNRNDLQLATESIVQMLRRGQQYAGGMHQDSAWSIRVENGGATLYKGTSFATRDTAFDETVDIPAAYTVSGLTDVSFAKYTTTPSSAGSLTLTGINNETRIISLNAEGMVSY